MPFVCQSYVLVCQPYKTRFYSHGIHMSLVCTSVSFLCHSYVLVCHPYVTRMYSYVIRMWLLCGFTLNPFAFDRNKKTVAIFSEMTIFLDVHEENYTLKFWSTLKQKLEHCSNNTFYAHNWSWDSFLIILEVSRFQRKMGYSIISYSLGFANFWV